jgi:intracellular septation protein A
MTEAAARVGKWAYPYRRPFTLGPHACEVLIRSGLAGNESTLSVDGKVVAGDFTPAVGEEGARNHRLETTLPDGRRLSVEAGYINWITIAIAARVDGELVHESHPGRTIAMPESARKMMSATGKSGDYDSGVWKRNRIPIGVDIALGLLFFVVAKLTDLTTAALVGAGVGLALLVTQRLTKIDLLGGLALFGIALLLLSAGFALAFQSDEAVKYRTTAIGLVSAALFFADGAMGGKRLSKRLMRYLPYTDIDPVRLGLGMGVLGAVMALANLVVALWTSTDTWLFYSTFADFPVTMVLIILVFRYARGETWRERMPRYRPAEARWQAADE